MIETLPDPYGLLDAWRRGDVRSALPLADWCEETGNPDGLPLAGFRELGAAGRVPFEGPPLGVLADEHQWRRPPLRSERPVVWSWLLSNDEPWSLPQRALDGFTVRRHHWEAWGPVEEGEFDDATEFDWRYYLDEGLVGPYGDPAAIVVARTRRIVEVADFALAVVVAALGYEVANGVRSKPNVGGLPPEVDHADR